MKLKKRLFAASFLIAALAGCSAEATTSMVDAETQHEAVEAYLNGICEGNSEQVIHQMASPERSGDSGFEPALKAAKQHCERYGGFSAFRTTRLSPSGEIIDGVIEFQDGTESNVNQRFYIESINGYYKVSSSTPRLCRSSSRGCFQ